MTADFGDNRIDLAREADFRLGEILVHPSSRQIEVAGSFETLEPRVMQVLVVLARRAGQVVSRDDLIRTCWEGRVVGEDALNRGISKVRKVGEAHAGFRLETIPRVGYRLWTSGDAESATASLPAGSQVDAGAEAAKPPSRGKPTRTQIAAAAGVVAALVLLVAAFALWHTGARTQGLDPSIAVLPFANLNGDSSKDYLANGIAGELIETLSQIDKLKVVGRGSSFSYKPDADPRTVGPALNVANVLSGTVSQGDDGLHISFELVDAASGRTILSRTYASALTTDNIATAQRYVAEQVAGALSIAFDIRGGRQLYGAGTRSLEAYDDYLQGRDMMVFGSTTQSENLFAKAVAADPNYGAAWGLMAIAHGARSWNRPTPAEGRADMDAAYVMAKKAVTLGPNISTSQAIFANLSTAQHKWGDAETASLLALDLSVNEISLAHRQLILFRSGRITEADALYRALEQVAPNRKIGAPKQSVLPALGRLDELRAMMDRPDWSQSSDVARQVARLESLIELGGPASDVHDALEVIARQPDRTLSEFAKAVLAVFDNKEKARRVLRTWYDGPGFEKPLKYELVPHLAAWYGDTDLVLRVWRDDLPINVTRMQQVWGPAYAPARATPQFKALMQDMGLVDYWRANKWADKCRPVGASDFECG